MPKDAIPVPVLTTDQKAYINEWWHKHDLRTLVQKVFNDPTLDLRSIQAKAVRQELALTNRPVIEPQERKTPIYKPREVLQMTEEQKLYVSTNYLSATGPMEIARTIFNNPKLSPTSPEVRAVSVYIREIDPSYRKEEELCDGDWEPPVSISHVLGKVNRYATNPRADGKSIYSSSKLSAAEHKCLTKLQDSLNSPLFKAVMNGYRTKVDRELVESTFINHTWNKPDLLPEEVQQYIALADETTKQRQINRLLQHLDERLSEMLNDEDGQLKMTEVELLNSVREKANASAKQITSLIEALIGKRSQREKDRMSSNSSLHNLVQAWKDEEQRMKIIMMNEKRQKVALKDEIARLSDMDSLKAEIFGVSKEDLLK
jgi:hypothetical protein